MNRTVTILLALWLAALMYIEWVELSEIYELHAEIREFMDAGERFTKEDADVLARQIQESHE